LGAVIAFAVTVAVISFLTPSSRPAPSAEPDAGLARPNAVHSITAKQLLPIDRVQLRKNPRGFEGLQDGGGE
jgi:hypothetical protein